MIVAGHNVTMGGVFSEVFTPAVDAVEAVHFSDVVKRYGSVVALADVDIRIGAGETVALLGPNGAGKSTTINIMLGLLRPDVGTATLFGLPPEAAVRSGRVSAMLQSGGLPEHVKVHELISSIRGLYPRPLALDDALRRAGLEAVAEREVQRLSGGQAQRVRFALAIVANPELIFLDEPTTGMDVQARRAFWESMRAFASEGRTVLFATHYLEEADAIADRVIVLNRGHVVADGSATEIKSTVTTRYIRFTLRDADAAALRTLPDLADVETHGDSVLLASRNADATLRALYTSDATRGLAIRDVEVTGPGLEEAFLALTRDEERP